MQIRVAILTVSDTASKDSSADKSGPLIKQLLQDNNSYQCISTSIVPDDATAIKDIIEFWCKDGVIDWIITTGGTGFGVRDRTPEAVSALLERQASGLVHFLIASSIVHTPLAALSRPVAGTIGKTLIITLPGSVKAVRECVESILSSGIIEHAVELIKGGTGSALHYELSRDDSELHRRHLLHQHAGDHGLRSPREAHSSVTSRHRKSPFPMISYKEAMELIFKETPLIESLKLPVTSAITGHVLDEDIYASNDIPSVITTNVDGYALHCSDLPGHYNVVTPQSHALQSELPENTIYRINTGAPLPKGTDSVIMVEDTVLISTSVAGAGFQEEAVVQTLTQMQFNENVRTVGSDVKKGELVMSKGEVLRGPGGELGTLAFVGCAAVQVIRKPMVAILSTGNELVDLQQGDSMINHKVDATWSGIWDTNRPSLQAAVLRMGYEVFDLGIVRDDVSSHLRALKRGLEVADIIITTGGTSMGSSDLLKPIIEQDLEGEIHFGRVAIKPGKPTTFATVLYIKESVSVSEKKVIFALPGNPASALVTFFIFVVPALRKMGGWPENRCQLPRVRVQLLEPVALDPRIEFHRIAIISTKNGLKASSTGGQRSSRANSLKRANGLAILPMRNSDEPKEIGAGDWIDAIVIDEIYDQYL